jgi:spermidine/putrescine transport system ATP-binding protein
VTLTTEEKAALKAPWGTVAPLLEIRGISKSFGRADVLSDFSLSVNPAEFLTLVGPSGCGKTTILRLIAGFEKPRSGRIFLAGRDVTDLAPYRRDIHTVFQSYALFPHYDVFENVAFSLRIRGLEEESVRERVAEALALTKLAGLERRKPDQLSGGQMQRVALARSLAGRPSLLLLDEPLGALDLKLRREMQLELKNIQRRLGIAFVYVTHDQEEATTMSDRIVVLNRGRIEQLGEPREIYEKPRTSFVANFMGAANVLEARVLSSSASSVELKIEDEIDCAVPNSGPASAAPSGRVYVAVRPERVAVHAQRPDDQAPGILARVQVKEHVFLGHSSQVYLKLFEKSRRPFWALCRSAPMNGALAPGQWVWAQFRPEDVLMLEPVERT